MASTLHDILLAPDNQPAVVADCLKLIEQEVASKSGVSGTAVKLSYKTAKSLASGYLQSTVESLLPDLVAQLEPFWADYGASGASGFGDYLAKRGDEVSEALLSGERRAGPAILSRGDHQGLPHRPRRRGQARHRRPARRRRPGAEVRGLSPAYLAPASPTGSSSTGSPRARLAALRAAGCCVTGCCVARSWPAARFVPPERADQPVAPAASSMAPMVQPSG